MPLSTSKTKRPNQQPPEPPPAPPEVAGPLVPVPEIAASGPKTAVPRKKRAPRPERKVPRLADTAGPEPGTPPTAARLTVGAILAPHGVNGEFKLKLHTDDPEHLLTLKRLYLGDEAKPRTVLSARMHQGNALLRVQGISTPETVEGMRGTLLSIRGADARPLAENEYFLYQMIGLEVFDEDGNRLGRVTDLMETGANDVLVVTSDDGKDFLLPSHPDVVIAMDPAAGRLVVRPLHYYGE